MELLTLDTYDAEIVVNEIIYDVKFRINWDCAFAEPQITEIFKDDVNVIEDISYSVLSKMEDLIDRYGDKKAWVQNKGFEDLDCFEYFTSHG